MTSPLARSTTFRSFNLLSASLHLRSAATAVRMQAAKLFATDRLDMVMGDAKLDRPVDQFLVSHRREDDDRGRFHFAQHTVRHCDAVQTGHDNVQQDHVGTVTTTGLYGPMPVTDHINDLEP